MTSPDDSPADLSDLGRALFGEGGDSLTRRDGGTKPIAWVPPAPADLQKELPQYEVMKMLGRGGMGAVYMGRQTSLERPVAIKILSTVLEDEDAGFVDRFKNEARAMARLNHPGIVNVYDFGQTAGGLLFIVMEYVDGTDVARMITASGRVHTDHAMSILAHVCDALAYAHERGIIHRDIKPANIMVGFDGRVKVADFGLAKINSANGSTMGLTRSGMALGTPHYIAPEAIMPGLELDNRADIYALGVMLYQMLTGKLPHGMFQMPSLLVPGLDPRYDGIIRKALMEDREERYQDVKELRHDLDSIVTQPVPRLEKPAVSTDALPPVLPSEARPRRPGAAKAGQDAQIHARRPSALVQRRFSLPWLIAACLVVAAAVLGYVFFSFKGTSGPASGPLGQLVDLREPAQERMKHDPPLKGLIGSREFELFLVSGPEVHDAAVLSEVLVRWDEVVDSLAALFERAANRPGDRFHLVERAGIKGGQSLYTPSIGAMEFTPETLVEITQRHREGGQFWSPIAVSLLPAYNSTAFRSLGHLSRNPEADTVVNGLLLAVALSVLEPLDLKKCTPFDPAARRGTLADTVRQMESQLDTYEKDSTRTWASVLEMGIGSENSHGSAHLFAAMIRRIAGPQGARALLTRLLAEEMPRLSRIEKASEVLPAFAAALSRSTPQDLTARFRAWRWPLPEVAPVPKMKAALENSLGMTFLPLPGTQTLMAMHETRRRDYEAFAAAQSEAAGSAWKSQNHEGLPAGHEPDHPVVGVNWQQANAFCAWLSQKEGRRYRLPTDREWSIAVGIAELEDPNQTPERLASGLPDIFPWGKQWPPPSGVANLADASLVGVMPQFPKMQRYKPVEGGYEDGFPSTAPVMSFRPNASGFFDLSGNAWEWTADWYNGEKRDRAVRGACWDNHPAYYIKSSFRLYVHPLRELYWMGFRVVLDPS